MNRIVFLDIAKAICIILVVVGHYMPDNSPMWYVMLNKVIYTFHMPLFMFVSGYVYIATKKDISYGSFLMKKVKRLMIPYFTTSVIVITIKLLTQDFMLVEAPCNPFIFFWNIVFAGSWLFSLVYLGIVVDVCYSSFLQNKDESWCTLFSEYFITFHTFRGNIAILFGAI